MNKGGSKLENFIERLVVLVMCLFLFAYTGYQLTRDKKSPYLTEPAFSYTIADSIKTEGVIVREEKIIGDKVASGAVRYRYSDGEMVSRNAVIAEVYSSESDIIKQKQIRTLENEIKNLEKVSDKRSLEYSNTERINQQINDTIDDIIATVDSGVLAGIDNKKDKLVYLLNQRAVATGTAENFDNRLEQAKSEMSTLKSQLSGNYNEHQSPSSGYFARMTDGLENELNFETASTMKVADFEKIQTAPINYNGNSFGKIIQNHVWYYAVVMKAKQAERFVVGEDVNVDFPIYNLSNIPFAVDEVRTDDSSKNVLVMLKTNYVIPELLLVRNPSATIKFKSFTGLKIPPSAKRYDGLQSGVYVLENNTVRFKTINVIYESDTYILCGANPDTEKPLKLYDQVILEGTDLKDGK